MVFESKISMRKSALRDFGGSLRNMYFVPRFEQQCTRGNRSRDAGTICRKDFRVNGNRNYRPWRFRKG